jgi:hypothetical protein
VNVGLDFGRFFSLGEDFEELFVREEVETGEEALLAFEVLVETLLDLLELDVGILQRATEIGDFPDGFGGRVTGNVLHEAFPDAVDLSEDGTVLTHLVHQIF